MTKKKSAKRAFISSFMSFIMCFAMLAGTTFAWYTDSVTSSGNKIVAGTLDIELWKYEGDDYVNISNSTAPIFQSVNQIAQNVNNDTLWEPGKTQVAYLKLVNKGNLWLKYQVALKVTNVTKDLDDVMLFKIVEAEPDEVTAWDATGASAVADNTTTPAVLAPNADYKFALVIHMDENAGNDYMGGEIDFDITVLATQQTEESDSFGNQYDANAQYPVVSVASTAAITSNNTSEDLTIQQTGEIKSATVPAAAANALFESVVAAANAGSAGSNEVTLTLNVSKTGETTTSAGTTVALDIDMTAVLESTTGGVTTTTTSDVTNFSNHITINYDLGAGLTNVTATHKGNAMVNSTDTAADAGHGIYSYDPVTGVLTIKTKTLSPFAVSYEIAPADIVVTKNGVKTDFYAADYNDSLASAFDHAMDFAFDNKGGTSTVLVNKDITFEGAYSYYGDNTKTTYNGKSKTLALPDDQLPNVTIDFGGHTLNYLYSDQVDVTFCNANVTLTNGTVIGGGWFGIFDHCGGGDLTLSNATITGPGFCLIRGADQTVKNDLSGYDVATITISPYAFISCIDDWSSDAEAIAGVGGHSYYNIANDCTVSIISRENGVILFEFVAND